MKKILSGFIFTVLFLLGMSINVEAAKVAVVVDAPLFYIHDSKTQMLFEDKCRDIFGSSADVISMKTSTDYVQVYREEHDIAGLVSNANAGEVSYEWPLKKEEIAEICSGLGSDYVFAVKITGNSKANPKMFASTTTAFVDFDAKIYNAIKKDYTYSAGYTGEKKEAAIITRFYSTTPRYVKMMPKLVDEMLKKITVDKNQL